MLDAFRQLTIMLWHNWLASNSTADPMTFWMCLCMEKISRGSYKKVGCASVGPYKDR